jgi:hypothetical protein
MRRFRLRALEQRRRLIGVYTEHANERCDGCGVLACVVLEVYAARLLHEAGDAHAELVYFSGRMWDAFELLEELAERLEHGTLVLRARPEFRVLASTGTNNTK